MTQRKSHAEPLASCLPAITGLLEQTSWAGQMEELNGLFVTATPLGHREDITLRALTTLSKVDAILCEDTRTTRQLLAVYAIATPCYGYHAHNERTKLNGVLALLERGKKLALVSDRGTPLICDPGWILVQACHAHNIPVHGLPGACSAVLALTLSGFRASEFCFQGFFPRSQQPQWVQKMQDLACPIVLFESPHRLEKTVDFLAKAWPDRQACLLRELTKKFEERVCMPLRDLALWIKSTAHLGECVLVIQGHLKKEKVS